MADITQVRTWLGIDDIAVPDASMQECLDMATEYVGGALTARGVGIGGASYEVAVKYMTAVNVLRRLDIMGIKPSSLATAGITIASDLDSAIAKFIELTDNAIDNAVKNNARSRTDLYIRHIRSAKL